MYRKLLPEQNTAMWAGNLPSSVVAKELESNIECVLEIVLRCVLGNRLGGVIRNLLRVHMCALLELTQVHVDKQTASVQ